MNRPLPSFKEILKKVSDAYKSQREKIIKQKDLIVKSLELKKNSVLNQDLAPILEMSLSQLDPVKGGYKGAPKFPTFNLYETLLYFYNTSKDQKYLKPVEIIINQLCSKGIYDHVEGGIARYTIDEDWIIPHFEKMLYDNAQFILLLSKYCKIKSDNYLKDKLEQTIEFLKKNFINSEGFLGSAFDADSEGEEGKYYTYSYNEIKDLGTRSVRGIINRGGTMLYSARSNEFRTKSGREKAYKNIYKFDRHSYAFTTSGK